MSADADPIEPTLLEAWQRHVLQCAICARARNGQDLCTMGQNFWRIPGSATMPVSQQPQPAAAVSAMPAIPTQAVAVVVNAPPAFDLNALASRVSERVIARTSTGAAIAVPMEKTSKSVEIRTSRDVTLQMPERDIEVYTIMKGSIGRLMRLAEALGVSILASDEARILSRGAGVVLQDHEVALVVRKATEARGMGGVTMEQLYGEFSDVSMLVIRLGDAMGRFMMVDAETREVMRDVRKLGIEMQGELERAIGGSLQLDDGMRKITRALRMVAVSLQGEMERRLGT